jgi:hypothetical protein
MTAVVSNVVPFPSRTTRTETNGRNSTVALSSLPVRVTPDGFGAWWVTWRKYGELHGSREEALAEAWAVAAEYWVRVIVVETFAGGGAA